MTNAVTPSPLKNQVVPSVKSSIWNLLLVPMLPRHAAVRIRAAADCAAGKPLRRLEQKQREQGGALGERAYDDMLVRCVRSVSQGAEAVQRGGHLIACCQKQCCRHRVP